MTFTRRTHLSADCFSVLTLVAAAMASYVTAPTDGDFWWSEAPRNALNGAFMLDLLRELPFDDPVRWAVDYYYQYPALTILAYPPLFHAVLAVFYLVFGVSHATAVACVSVCFAVLAAGVYALARRISPPAIALTAALMLLAAPEAVRWGQQVMLDIPMLALAVWSAFFLLRYGDRGRPYDLAVSAALMVAALYTKQTAAIIAPALVVSLVLWRGRKALLSRHLWLIAIVAVLVLVPLGYIQLKFGWFHVMAVVDRPDVSIDRTSLSGIAWYARHLPAMLGLPVAALAVVYLVGCAVRRDWWPANGDSLVHGCWLGLTYVALIAIDVKDTRFGLILLVPLVIAAALALDRLAPNRAVRQIAPVLAFALFISTLANNPTPTVSGYHEAVDRVAELAPEGARVVFAGNRDGSFIFNLRAHERRRDLSVIRADKLFLGIAILPSLGLNPKDFSKDQIASMLNRYGVSYVVTVPRVWAETLVMARFAAVLESDQFEEVARVPVNGAAIERELVIYRNNGPLTNPPEDFEINLRQWGVTLSRD